jgi:hypothetical protein
LKSKNKLKIDEKVEKAMSLSKSYISTTSSSL